MYKIKQKNNKEYLIIPIDHYKTFKNFINHLNSSKECLIKIKNHQNLHNTNKTTITILIIIKNNIYYIPINMNKNNHETKLNQYKILDILKIILENPKINKIGFNIKNEYKILKQFNINLNGNLFDITIESFIINNSINSNNLHDLSNRYLKYDLSKNEYKIKCISKPTFNIEFDLIKQTIIINMIHKKLFKMLNIKEKKILLDTEIPIIKILSSIENKGILINKKILLNHKDLLEKRISIVKKKIFSLTNKPFNLNSTKQLQEILFKNLKIPVLERTSKGKPSTSESVLKKISHKYKISNLILEYRTLYNTITTYIQSLLQHIHPIKKKIHTNYNQTTTITGRLSSNKPNLQNIPIKKEQAKMIRQAFISHKKFTLISADYSQIELRIAAFLSKEKKLIQNFNKGIDIHTLTASEIFSTKIKEITYDQRQYAKKINFSLLYGISAFGLSKQLNTDQKKAQQYIESYYKTYPKLKKYLKSTQKKAIKKKYVKTLFGRRIYLINNKKKLIKNTSLERTAINAPIQGTASDIMKKAMILTYNWCKSQKFPIWIIMQIHDELIFEVCDSHLIEATHKIKLIMENVVTSINIPLKITINIGKNLKDLKPLSI
ncbi:DNA polymerase [Candidatus Legionella polyplacis]|uniref:DNA-directed DNA polymerase n=1 Tax=Candidatus Legionella polyplacis TaxID=2005262 RepID=A0ABZ2GXH6_9GAMM